MGGGQDVAMSSGFPRQGLRVVRTALVRTARGCRPPRKRGRASFLTSPGSASQGQAQGAVLLSRVAETTSITPSLEAFTAVSTPCILPMGLTARCGKPSLRGGPVSDSQTASRGRAVLTQAGELRCHCGQQRGQRGPARRLRPP